MKKKRKPSPLDINLFELHEEARKQAATHKSYTDMHANALNKRDVLEAAMELKAAELMLRINKKPKRFGFHEKPPTVDQAKAAVTAHPEYQEAIAVYLEAKHEAQMHKGLVDASEQRKSMIEKEIELWFASYFASPKVPKKRERRE